MKARILEAISFITEDNWTDTARIRKDVFFKLFGKREAIVSPKLGRSERWVATGAANRIIDAEAFGHGKFIFTMCYNQYYATVIRRLYGEVVLVDDYTVEEFIEDLQQLRRQAKKDLAMCYVNNIGSINSDEVSKHKAIMVQTKATLNMMFSVFMNYDYGVNCENVVEYARLTIRKDCKKLQDEVGAIILTVNTDTIVLVAKKIPSLSFDTHNNIFNNVLIGAYAGQYAEITKSCDNGGFLKISRMPKAMGRIVASQKEFNDAV